MIRRNRYQREILGQFWDRLEIAPDDQDWLTSIECELRRVPDDVLEILDDLAEEFGRDELLESGIAAQDETGVLMPSVQLSSRASVLLLVPEGTGELPIDILSPHGIVLGDELPAYVTAHEHRTAVALRSLSGLTLVVPTLADVIAYRVLGVAAVPSVGIERSNIDGLRQIQELRGTPSQLRSPSAAERQNENADEEDVTSDSQSPRVTGAVTDVVVQEPPECTLQHDDYDTIDFYGGDACSTELIIANWSLVHQHRVPEDQMRRLISRLADAQRYLPIDLSHVAVWVPTENDVARIRFCWELQDRSSVVEAVMDSVSHSSYTISSVPSRELSPWQTPDTYLQARSALWRSLRNTASDSADRGALIESFEYLLQSQMIGPLLEAGVANTDPIFGTLQIELANISSLLQSQAPFLQHDLIQASVQTESRDRRSSLECSILLRMQLVDRLVRIARELRR